MLDELLNGSTASSTFIGREVEIDVFLRQCDRKKTEQNEVLNYYGINGIGKKMLLEHLHSRVLKDDQLSAIYSFEKEENRSIESLILGLSKELNQVRYYSFSMAYLIYLSKKNPYMTTSNLKGSFSENYDPVIELVDSYLPNALEQLVPMVEEVMPGIMGPLKIVEKLVDQAVFRKNVSKDIRRALQIIKEWPPHKIEEYLIVFFKHDLEKYLTDRRSQVTIFIYDVDRLYHTRENRQALTEVYDWLFKIINEFPTVNWILSSTDAVQYSNDLLTCTTKECLLPSFTDSEARMYLENEGVVEQGIQKVIMETAQGLPLLLKQCVELYHQRLSTGREIVASEFKGHYTKILRKIIGTLTDDTRDVLFKLASIETYDRELFEELIDLFNLSYSKNNWEVFNHYSFVRTIGATQGTFAIDSTVKMIIKEVVENDLSKDALIQSSETLLRHYLQKITSTSTYDQNKKYMNLVMSQWVNLLELNHQSHLYLVIAPKLNLFSRYGDISYLLECYRRVYNVSGDREYTKIIANYLIRLDHRDEALTYINEYHKYVMAYDEESDDKYTLMSDLGHLYNAVGAYDKAIAVYSETLAWSQKRHGQLALSAYEALESLADLLFKQKRYKESIIVYKQVKQVIIANRQDKTTLEHCIENADSDIEKEFCQDELNARDSEILVVDLAISQSNYYLGKGADLEEVLLEKIAAITDRSACATEICMVYDFLSDLCKEDQQNERAEYYMLQAYELMGEYTVAQSIERLTQLEKLMAFYLSASNTEKLQPLVDQYEKCIDVNYTAYSEVRLNKLEQLALYQRGTGTLSDALVQEIDDMTSAMALLNKE